MAVRTSARGHGRRGGDVIDPTITIGNLLEVAAIVLGGAAVYIRLVERLARIEVKVSTLWTAFVARRRKTDPSAEGKEEIDE